ncbi:transglutaminase-like domain-containing protein [Crateriforma conspicua]|uniref:Transglutaminase-like domain-containing protein n=1 Tax=Crateriforma conspicua TaxID=2527996 RepID=A0A5C5Y9E9_9PLAN|nr:transglutaminase-like domain-containing protein [Crateriforma conspicua]TWT70945.1 hypothetical protein Pan14r_32530 [Crateriforma conspicua]
MIDPIADSPHAIRQAAWALPLTHGLGVILALGLCVGCDLPERPIVDKKPAARPTVPSDEETFEVPTTVWNDDWDAWFYYVMDQRPVGYSHISARMGGQRRDDFLIDVPAAPALELMRTETRSNSLWFDVRDVIRFDRGNASFIQSLSQVTRESVEGELRSFWSQLRVGPAETQSIGVVENDQLSIETFRGQRRITQNAPWEDSVRGAMAVIQSLQSSPMQPGETRKIKHILPITNELATVNLSAISKTSVPWHDGTTRMLLEVIEEVNTGGQTSNELVLWVDDEGQIQRTFTPALRLLSYRVNEEELPDLLEPADGPGAQLDTDNLAMTPPAWAAVEGKKIDAPERASRVAFVITPIRENPDQPTVLEPAPDQYFNRMKDGRIRLLISRQREKISQGFEPYETESGPGDTRPTSLLNFNASNVRELGRVALKGLDLTEREMAVELNRTVHTLVQQSTYAGQFTRASDVLLASQGGAMESSVLLAALLRERKLPSRLALGLVYVPGDQPKLAFTVWTLALADGSWISLDPVTGREAPADRIVLKMLDTTKPIDRDVFVPIFQWMQNTKIRVQGFSLKKEEEPVAEDDDLNPELLLPLSQ